jgi:hypothetical protein
VDPGKTQPERITGTALSQARRWLRDQSRSRLYGSGERAMAQPNNPISEEPVTFQPPCPTCGNPMWLMRLSAFNEDHDLRTFRCQVCGYTDSMVVKFK